MVCRELTPSSFSDWPLDSPRTVVHLCKHMGKHGLLPSGFLDRWARSRRVEETDRVYHELRALVDTLQVGGSYDSLNLGSLAMAETIARRLQTILDAYEQNATQPKFESARFFNGFGAATDAVSPELRSFVVRRARPTRQKSKSLARRCES